MVYGKIWQVSLMGGPNGPCRLFFDFINFLSLPSFYWWRCLKWCYSAIFGFLMLFSKSKCQGPSVLKNRAKITKPLIFVWNERFGDFCQPCYSFPEPKPSPELNAGCWLSLVSSVSVLDLSTSLLEVVSIKIRDANALPQEKCHKTQEQCQARAGNGAQDGLLVGFL